LNALKAVSINLDQMKVLGDAIALICDRSEPGNGSASGRFDGMRDIRASRNSLDFGSKHKGAPRSIRPPIVSEAKAP
jgi:hypothetical protein